MSWWSPSDKRGVSKTITWEDEQTPYSPSSHLYLSSKPLRTGASSLSADGFKVAVTLVKNLPFTNPAASGLVRRSMGDTAGGAVHWIGVAVASPA